MLPGKGWPVRGSLMMTRFPLASVNAEKSPLRSAAVGTSAEFWNAAVRCR